MECESPLTRPFFVTAIRIGPLSTVRWLLLLLMLFSPKGSEDKL